LKHGKQFATVLYLAKRWEMLYNIREIIAASGVRKWQTKEEM
jgi:hypothetical protein